MNAPVRQNPVIYPESDGKPMADNTIQFRWIQTLSSNLFILFRDRSDVFVGGNLFWYPVENFPDIVQAPDVFVVVGRPPGDRPSYKQWEEENVPMTVVFEIRSPNDGDALMQEKFEFYDEHGVEEYYVYDPDTNALQVYLRRGGNLGPQRLPGGTFSSPRLGIRFDLRALEMIVSFPSGEPFLSAVELKQRQEQDAARAEAAQRQAEAAHREAEAAHREAETAQKRAETVERQAVRLRELSRKALRGLASPEELVELEQLVEEPH